MKRMMECARWLLHGAGQVMFMGHALTGLLFLVGIFAGSYLCGTPAVAWGAAAGLVAATLGGRLWRLDKTDGQQGLWGFNGILIGCALTTFFGGAWPVWAALVVLSALSPWVRVVMNKAVAGLGINSLTFPFIALTWLAFAFGFPPAANAAPAVLSFAWPTPGEAWLNGVSQIFLVGSPLCGALFLAGLLVASRRAAIWCAVGSAIGAGLAFLCRQGGADIAGGLFGFNPALTAIALGAVFRRSVPVVLIGIVVTFFVQLVFALTFQGAIPALTAPFCLTTWRFLANPKK